MIHIIKRIDKAILAKGEERYKRILDEVLDTVLDVGKSIFAAVAPANTVPLHGTPTGKSLHTLLYPTRPPLASQLLLVL